MVCNRFIGSALIIMLAVMPASGSRIMYGFPNGTCNLLVPDGDTSSTNWTAAGAGALYLDLDDSAGDNCFNGVFDPAQTSYIECGESVLCDAEFTLSDTSGIAATDVIHYIVVYATAIKFSGSAHGGHRLSVDLILGGTPYNVIDPTTAIIITTSQYSWFQELVEINPDTSAPWTASDLDAMSLNVDQTVSDTFVSRVGQVAIYIYSEPRNRAVEASEPRIRKAGGN